MSVDEKAKQLAGKAILRGMDPLEELLAVGQDSCFYGFDLDLIPSERFYCDQGLVFPVACMAYNSLLMDMRSPQVELGRLSTFGAKKYSLHQAAPNSWRGLPLSTFIDSMTRHLAGHRSEEPHRETIGKDCTSCAPQYLGTRYEGKHATAVLWSAIRYLALAKEGA